MAETLEAARDAFDRRAWPEAVEAFTALDRSGDLTPDDLESLGTAHWWIGNPDESNEVLERAFHALAEAGRPEDAARVAMTLAYQAFRGLTGAVGGAWIGRAAGMIATLPESPIHARLKVFQALGELQAGRLAEGVAMADEAIAIGRRTDSPTAIAAARSFKASGMILAGDWETGFAELDEAAAAASSGQLELRVASDIFCNTIAMCRSAGDLDRAAQWADESERWMRRNGAGGYPGICRVHRAEIKLYHGDWSGAEQEARQACDELRRFRLLDVIGLAQYQIGEVRLRMGDLEAASDAFDQAYEFGHDAQPGLARLQLARGEVEDARRSIARTLAATQATGETVTSTDRLGRARLLPAQVDIALAANDLETARLAVEELESIAADFERPLFRAGALMARGELLLGEDRPSEASPMLGQSWRLWQTNDLPYESARARLHYAEALLGEGDTAMARRDLQAARSTFERLGAKLDLQRVDAILGESGGAGGGAGAATGSATRAERVTRTFMFTDIVTSTDLLGLIGDEAWTELLRWHDRELRASFAQHAGDENSHTGDGFFVVFERGEDGVACAVDIQRRLARHRREHGFAPWVRIGLHAAEATREGRKYTGGGVHVAARVGAAAGKEEILVSAAVLEGVPANRFRLSEPRPVTLKGVKDAVEVRSVDWR